MARTADIELEIMNACMNLLELDTYETTSTGELVVKYTRYMGYYYAIQSLIAQHDLDPNEVGRSDNWPELYRELRDEYGFLTKYSINPLIYMDPETNAYKSYNGFTNVTGHIAPNGVKYTYTYAYTEDCNIIPNIVELQPGAKSIGPAMPDNKIELAAMSIRHAAQVGDAQVSNIVNVESLDEVVTLICVSDGIEIVTLFKLGEHVTANISKDPADISVAYQGEHIYLN